MSKIEVLARMKGLFGVLIVLTLGVLIIIPLTSMLEGVERSFVSDMGIYVVLLAVWIVLAIAFGVIYLASEGGKSLSSVALPGRRREGVLQ